MREFKEGVCDRDMGLCARKCVLQFLVFLTGLVNSVQGHVCSKHTDCQYPGCNDRSCLGLEAYFKCNNGVWYALCVSTCLSIELLYLFLSKFQVFFVSDVADVFGVYQVYAVFVFASE